MDLSNLLNKRQQRESSTWNSQDSSLSSISQDDFQQFLDMGITNLGDLDFDFQEFSGQESENVNGQMMYHDAGNTMDRTGPPRDVAQIQYSLSDSSSRSPERHPQNNDSLAELDAQIRYLQYLRQRQQHQRQIQEKQQTDYANKKTVPPTPDSTEMHGNGQTYSKPDVRNAIYERYQSQIKEQEMTTPLVSPAVTPLGLNFNIPEYTVPGAYFSPLASPALRPRNGPNIDPTELSYSSTITAEHGDPSKLPDATFTAATEMSADSLCDMPSYEDFSATLSEAPSFASDYALTTERKDSSGFNIADALGRDTNEADAAFSIQRQGLKRRPSPFVYHRSHDVFRMLQSNADPHSLHSHYTDLSDPPDLYASLHEEQVPPSPEDLNPSDPGFAVHEQDLRFDGDLYTPRWVRGHGTKREGWCGICKPGRWFVLENSAFWYDKSITHGISAATGGPFEEPQETRRMDGNPDVWDGLCSICGEWIALVSSKKGTTWFRHAYKCHTHPKIKDAPKRRRESSHTKALDASTMAKPEMAADFFMIKNPMPPFLIQHPGEPHRIDTSCGYSMDLRQYPMSAAIETHSSAKAKSTPNALDVLDQGLETSNKTTRLGTQIQHDHCGDVNARARSQEEIVDVSVLDLPDDAQTMIGTAADSGYASMGMSQTKDAAEEDDNQTIFTDNQDLDIADDVREKLSSALSNEILQRLQAIPGGMEGKIPVRTELASLLKEFSIRLRSTATLPQQTDATVFVRHYRQRIANTLETSLRTIRQNDESEEMEDDGENPLKAEIGFTLAEKMDLLLKNPKFCNGTERDVDDPGINEEEDSEEYAISHFPDAWKFLTKSPAYDWFVGKLKSIILLTEATNTVAENIHHEILDCLDCKKGRYRSSRSFCRATIDILDWPLREFLANEYPEEKQVQIGSIITITGYGVDAQALSCSEYMCQTWPTTGFETLESIQEALGREYGGFSKYRMADGTTIQINIQDTSVSATIEGNEPAVAEVGQQLAWLGSSLRSSFSDSICYCTPKMVSPRDSDAHFRLTFELQDIESGDHKVDQNGSCWLPLFRNPVIVKGYPILARMQGERGLEIPLNMMAGLGEALRVTDFDGGFLIKGFCTLFSPMKCVKDSVLWHYLFQQDGSRIPYSAADERCPNRTRHGIDTSCLQISRHFLGWTSSVECLAGTKDIKYNNIDWSGGNLASAGIALEKASLILGHYVSGGLSFTKGNKDTPIYLRKAGSPYEVEIQAASNMKVVLYDTVDRRGCLLEGHEALLHLTRTQLGHSPYVESKFNPVRSFRHAEPGIYTAKDALLDSKNRELPIFEHVDVSLEYKPEGQEERRITKRWTLEDLVRQTYYVLELMHDYEARTLTSSGVPLRFTARDKLLGFAFMDIVKGQSNLRPRVATLRSSGKGWADFTRTIRAVTLIGKGFGDIFRPSSTGSNQLCKRWSSVPKGKDYLVARTSTLRQICREDGDMDSNPMELAQGIYWHGSETLFASCNCTHGNVSSGCDRVQVLQESSLGSKRHPQPFHCPNGAVVFGRNKRFPFFWSSKEDMMESESDSEPDDSSGFQDSGIGGSNTSLSQSASSDSGNADASSSVSDVGPSSLDLPEVVMSETFANNTYDTTRSSPNEAPSSDQMGSLQISQVGPSNGKKRTWDKVQSRVPQFLQHKKSRGQ